MMMMVVLNELPALNDDSFLMSYPIRLERANLANLDPMCSNFKSLLHNNLQLKRRVEPSQARLTSLIQIT